MADAPTSADAPSMADDLPWDHLQEADIAASKFREVETHIHDAQNHSSSLVLGIFLSH